MATAIHISKEISAIVDQKGIHPILLANQPKLFHRSRRHFMHLSNDPSTSPALCLHAPLVAEKNKALSHQPDDVENEKENGNIDGDLHDGSRQGIT